MLNDECGVTRSGIDDQRLVAEVERFFSEFCPRVEDSGSFRGKRLHEVGEARVEQASPFLGSDGRAVLGCEPDERKVDVAEILQRQHVSIFCRREKISAQIGRKDDSNVLVPEHGRGQSRPPRFVGQRRPFRDMDAGTVETASVERTSVLPFLPLDDRPFDGIAGFVENLDLFWDRSAPNRREGEEGEEEGEAFHCRRGLVAFCVFGVFRGLFGGGRNWGPSPP